MLQKAENRINEFLKKKVSNFDPPNPEEYFGHRNQSEEVEYIKNILSEIQNNISILLSHISMMIAVLSIMLVVFDGKKLVSIFVICEMVAYIIIALICLYCLRWGSKPAPSKVSESAPKLSYFLYYEYLNRRYMHHFCIDATILITVFFILTIIVHVVNLLF